MHLSTFSFLNHLSFDFKLLFFQFLTNSRTICSVLRYKRYVFDFLINVTEASLITFNFNLKLLL